ncbi:acyl carrier protein [Streptomyces sp. BE230]|uniref:acyl carrier protein n=1 Tax=Streptomyces sp. BE230 TaxID=3002526 RepID=UPI002ED5B328|nr:acyl carrier protein [Streptomyces sp. BE230]
MTSSPSSSASLEHRLRQVFVDALQLPPGTAVEETHYQSTPTWDSLGHVLLVSTMENEFGVEIETERSLDMESFQVALALLKEKGAE